MTILRTLSTDELERFTEFCDQRELAYEAAAELREREAGGPSKRELELKALDEEILECESAIEGAYMRLDEAQDPEGEG